MGHEGGSRDPGGGLERSCRTGAFAKRIKSESPIVEDGALSNPSTGRSAKVVQMPNERPLRIAEHGPADGGLKMAGGVLPTPRKVSLKVDEPQIALPG